MLFKVRWSADQRIHVVYSVQRNVSGETKFLIYNENFSEPWQWVDAQECKSIEE